MCTNWEMNPLLETDFYKTIHHLAYVPGLDFLTSYWTPRKSRIAGISKVVYIGMQGVITRHLIYAFNKYFFERSWVEVEAEYREFIAATMTVQASDPTFLKELHELGYLPIRIRAVDEGTRVNIGTPMFEISNTVKGFGWLVNYLETYLSVNIWHMMTTATIAYRYREHVDEAFALTVDEGAASPWAACGDFSMRGMSSKETAYRASAGHLTSFTGTATIGSIAWLRDFYAADPTKGIVGKGVPSLEHSVVASYGREGEFECYRHVIEDVFPDGPLSVVSDTYDYFNVLTNFLPRLKPAIMKRNGKVVIRGDSGKPADILCGTLDAKDYMVVEGLTEDTICEYFKQKAATEYDYNGSDETWYNVRIGDYLYHVVCEHTWCSDDEDDIDGHYDAQVEFVRFDRTELTPEQKGTVELLWDEFGGHVNSKGFKVLDSHIGAIYGDAITYDVLVDVYARLIRKGFSVSCVTLGIGSYTYQYVTRDTFGFALKATHAVVDGEERLIYKDPVTDKGADNFKKSQRGLCYVYRSGDDVLYKDGLSLEEYNSPKYADNLLETVFEDGVLVKETTLDEIRDRLHPGCRVW